MSKCLRDQTTVKFYDLEAFSQVHCSSFRYGVSVIRFIVWLLLYTHFHVQGEAFTMMFLFTCAVFESHMFYVLERLCNSGS